MPRSALVILSVLAYLAAFLAPMLPAAAASQTVTVIEAPSHCGQHHTPPAVKLAGDHCQISCAAHSPALPSLTWLASEPPMTTAPLLPTLQRQWPAEDRRPDPRPPRTLSA